jgi:hypothetical protein
MTRWGLRVRPYPRQQPGVVVQRRPGTLVLASSDSDRRWAVNESALALWQLCDGETSREEMIDAICVLCHVNEERARADVAGTLRLFTSAGLISWTHEH